MKTKQIARDVSVIGALTKNNLHLNFTNSMIVLFQLTHFCHHITWRYHKEVPRLSLTFKVSQHQMQPCAVDVL